MFYVDYGTRGKDPQKVAAGRAGGKSRASKLTPEQRSESARKAIVERWRRYREEKARRRQELEARRIQAGMPPRDG